MEEIIHRLLEGKSADELKDLVAGFVGVIAADPGSYYVSQALVESGFSRPGKLTDDLKKALAFYDKAREIVAKEYQEKILRN